MVGAIEHDRSADVSPAVWHLDEAGRSGRTGSEAPRVPSRKVPSMSLILTELHDAIGTITLNYYEKRNALCKALIEEIVAVLAAFRDAHARAVVLRAAPGVTVWSAGHAIEELPRSQRDPLPWDDPLRCLIREIEGFPAPV